MDKVGGYPCLFQEAGSKITLISFHPLASAKMYSKEKVVQKKNVLHSQYCSVFSAVSKASM
jgi:nitroimidazol reductase NimA-like FMN-containing flavoprotein (pyridoxamine 5'-phosphate oxidase superfamily)